MNAPFPPNVSQRVRVQIEQGLFPMEDDVLRAAMTALEREEKDLAAIAAGTEDMEAGRYRPFTQIDATIPREHIIPLLHEWRLP